MARQRTPEGPPPAPTVQKLRIRYARRGRLRFSSTRDFARALERALRRAGVPMAFSAGFHPHPRISYLGAAPTGAASEAEYFEISLAERADPEKVRVALDAALPPGLDILTCVEAGPGALADRLEASVWEMRMSGVAPEALAAVLEAYLSCDRAEVTRTFRTGPRTFDTRAAVLSLSASAAEEPGCAILRAVVRHTTPTVRPDDILTALRALTSFTPPVAPVVTRLGQGPLIAGTDEVADPLAADLEVIGP